jgi:hypothetical protein
MMGDFTDKIIGGNGAKGANIPVVGSKHYEMAGIGFYMNQTPKAILAALVQNVVNQLSQAGHFEEAKKMADNPQPFGAEPAAMAVFMACFEELEKRDERIAELEQKVSAMRDDLSELQGAVDADLSRVADRLHALESQ